MFDLSFDRVFEHWATNCGVSANTLKDRFLFDALFDDFEKDLISEAEFRMRVCKRLKISLNDIDFDAGWCNLYLDLYDGIIPFLIQLKANYHIVALTNTNAIHYTYWPQKYKSVLPYFEKVFSSQQMACRKPEPKSYQMVLDYLELNASETVFLDDNPINVEGAENIGIRGILVTSFDQMKADLKTIGIE